ncbi:MAG: hypothetical protein ACJAWW_000604, partial [Sulfurimonas sp.]
NSGTDQDYFNIYVNSTQKQTYSVVDGTYIESFTAVADATGKVLLTFNPDTTDNSEQVEIDYIQINTISYCQENSLSEGFHIVDPDEGDDSNSYEIYCDMTSTKAPRDLIALPLKNDYNNFVFKDDSPSVNYYSQADAAITDDAKNSFSFLQIHIDGDTIEVEPTSVAEDSTNNEEYFSNINLIGTPFAIDWDNTTLSNCDTTKLRIGAFDQAVKINTLNYTNGRCKVESMRLKLLDEYKYLTYDDIEGTTNDSFTGAYGSEILEETCRQIFEKVPDDASHLPTLSGASNGYFWIDPDQGGRVIGDKVTTVFRPFVAYCKYQEDIEQAWTFVMALDAKVTNSKSDIRTMTEVRADPSVYHDTCSQLGLLFFVPNTKDTFQRTQSYLATNKNEWINYTGTIREKYQMYTNDANKEYYIAGEGYNEIWPYGPFGLYFPQSGNHYSDGTSLTWSSNMAGRCMNSGTNSGALDCTDYTKSVVTDDDQTMGIMGWRTTLMDQVAAGLEGITDGDQWWVADVGAGNYLTKETDGSPEYSVTGPGLGGDAAAHRTPYYEPNGNYSQYAWLNFISDSNGNVYHNDDNNDFYAYYDYMCMSWDNYYGITRYGLNEGPFTVIEHDNPSIDTSSGYPITTPTDLNITTKILQESKDFDILLLSDNRAQIINDQNTSAGVFLIKIDQVTSGSLTTNELTDLRYYGEIGTSNDFNLTANPRGVIALPDALSTITSAHQRLAFEFKYCGYTNDWNTCWTITGSGDDTKATCTNGYDSVGDPNSPCQVADSNDFALRPYKFGLSSTDAESIKTSTALIVKAKAVNIDYIAKDFSGNAAPDYNVSFYKLNTDITLINAGSCASTLLEDTNQTTFQFHDGIESDSVILNNVGKYTFVLEEVEGQEFAIVDATDTVWADRQITANDMSLIIKPDHFTLSDFKNPNFNTDGNFTYQAKVANLDNMSAKLDFNITAQSSLNTVTTNYTSGCYAEAVKLDVNYTVPVGEAYDLINYKVGTAAASSTIVSSTLGGSFINSSTESVPKTVFTDAGLGSANITVKFNFDRAIDTAKNPFTINLNNLNVSDQTTALVTNTTNQTIDSDATFVYGRAAGPKRASFTNCVDNPTNCTSSTDSPRIVFQIYKDSLGTNVSALTGATHDGTQDSRWWTSPFHDKNNILTDGNITTGSNIVEVTGVNVTQSSLVEESNFRYKANLNYNGNDGYVKEANLKHTPSPWLIYNENDASATYNTFNFNFITEGWSGKNESNTSTKTQSANRTSKRILW